MQFIKALVTLAIINAIIVIGLVMFLGDTKLVQQEINKTYESGFQVDLYESSPTPYTSAMVESLPVATTAPTATTNPTPTPTPTLVPSPTPTPTPSGCVVSIDGVKYNVDKLRFTHSGGDIFVCGTDMSVTFWQEHNNRILSKMQKYKI